MDSCGRLVKEAARFCEDLGDVANADSRASKTAFVRIVRQELSSALCRGNTSMYGRILISVACGVRGSSMPYVERAVDGVRV